MGKKSRRLHRSEDPGPSADGPGARQPCPCGSGRRYKACHGSGDSSSPYVARPFAGVRGEADLVALREFVPAATAPVRLADSVENPEDRPVRLCSLLPGATPAMVRQDGSIWLGLQVQHGYGDTSRDLGAVLEEALVAEPGSLVGLSAPPGDGARLQDLLADEPLEVTVHDGFDYWVADVDDPDGSLAGALEQANQAAAPTRRMTSVDAAYWTSTGDREYLRWVLPHDEDEALDALARLRVLGDDSLVEGDRLIGMFRTHGLVVPVWDLPVGTGAEALEEPLANLSAGLSAALDRSDALTGEERAARAGLASRQLTIR